MASTSAELTPEDFLFSHLAEYLDGDLPADVASRVAQAMQASGGEGLGLKFQAMRGKLQLALQSFYLREDELQHLRGLVQDPAVLATEENIKIEAIGRREFTATLLRRLALAAVVAAILGGVYWKFGRTRIQTFKPLEYLGYEALALEEEQKDRLNLPSRDMKEIRQYLASYPGLGFTPKVMQNLGSNWQPEGATVIDYEIAKVAVVIYARDRQRDKIFHFSYAGELSDLPATEPGNMRGLIFQTYASDELNLIAWQSAPGIVSLLVGRRSAPELAELAVIGSGKG